jgi:hypothetical protein
MRQEQVSKHPPRPSRTQAQANGRLAHTARRRTVPDDDGLAPPAYREGGHREAEPRLVEPRPVRAPAYLRGHMIP